MNDSIEKSPSNPKFKGHGNEDTFQENNENATQNLNEKMHTMQNTNQSIVDGKDGVPSPINTEYTRRKDNEPQSEVTNEESQEPEAQITNAEEKDDDYDESDKDVFYPSHLENMVHQETMRQLELAWNAQRHLAMLCCDDIKEIAHEKQ